MSYKKALELTNANRLASILAAQRNHDIALDNAIFYVAEMTKRKCELAFVKDSSALNRQNLDKAVVEYNRVVRELSINISDFEPNYKCKLCNDSGYYQNQYCKCVKILVTHLNANSSSSLLSSATFEKTNFNVFVDKSVALEMEKLYGTLMDYCTKFPQTKKKCIVLTGGIGCGKTHLASCVANRLIERGENILALTAFDLVNRALKYHTTFDDAKISHLSPMLDCDLLVIDDLGTESILKNVTMEYIYLIINERNVNNRHTMITTNLSMTQMESRYGSRICSRIFDSRTTFVKALTGKDIRTI